MDFAGSRNHLINDDSNESFVQSEQPVALSSGLLSRTKVSKEKNADGSAIFEATPSSSLTAGVLKDIPSTLSIEPLSPALTIGDNAGDEQSTTPGRIARPRNAFMLYRANFMAGEKINRSVEHDNRHISRIIGHCWQKLSKEEKLIWHQKAEIEKLEHAKKHPGYRFCPVPRAKKPLKRKGKRNGEKEMERCRQVADLLLAGKEGDELAAAIKRIDLENAEDSKQDSPETSAESYAYYPSEESRIPVFMNPLRPPPARNGSLRSVNHAPSMGYNTYTNSESHRQQYYPSPPESPASSGFMFPDNRTQNPYLLRPASFYPHSSLTRDTQTSLSPYSPGPSHGHMTYAQPTNDQYLQPQSSQINRSPGQSSDFFLDNSGQTFTFLSHSLPPTLAPSRYTAGNNFYGDSGI